MPGSIRPEGTNKPCIILNDFHPDASQLDEKALTEFTIYPRLPLEIKSGIWKCVLQHYLPIHISVIDISKDDVEPPPQSPLQPLKYATRNRLGNIISGPNYEFSIITKHRLSPLLSVSRESRQAALEYYRVHIPLAKNQPHCLYFNPEFDFLNITTEDTPKIIADFMHDVKAYDPPGLGILNVVFSIPTPQFPYHIRLPMDPSNLSSLALSSFKATLNNLQRVFFQDVVYGETRLMFCSLDMAEARFNRSFPVNSLAEDFDIFETDPRPIDTDLGKVHVGDDPRAMFCIWQEMEHKFEIEHSKPVEFKYLITAPTYGCVNRKKISTRTDAEEFLGFEEKLWRECREGDGLFKLWNYKHPDTPEKASMPAIGFWMFPLEAFGDMPEGAMRNFEPLEDSFGNYNWGRSHWDSKMVANLTGFRPQIGLFSLP